MSNIFVGYRTQLAPTYSEVMEPIKAPKNYKDPVKISQYLAEAEEQVRANSAAKPFTAVFESATMYYAPSSLEFPGIYSQYTGLSGLAKLLEDMDDAISAEGEQLMMFDASDFMQIVSVQAIKEGIDSRLANSWIARLPILRDRIVDLPRIFLVGEDYSRIGVYNMFKYFGVSLTNADMENTKTQCSKLKELYDKLKNFPEVSNAKLMYSSLAV